MKTDCINSNGMIQKIGSLIYTTLGKKYYITDRIINFKDYGANSSRKRTLVIGVLKKIANYITPFELFPDRESQKTLRQVIGNLESLGWDEFSKNDFYHHFRIYPIYMRKWISCLKEGESAFNNLSFCSRPYHFLNNK